MASRPAHTMEIVIPTTELIFTNQLKTDQSNPNKMKKEQFDALKKNIQKYGFFIPIITNKDLVIADGFHRWKAARELGMSQVPVIALPIEEVDRKILRQVLNKLKGEHDPDLDLFEYESIMAQGGIDELYNLLPGTDYKALLNAEVLEAKDDEFEEDSSKPPKYDVKIGEIYQLGEHRLMCGDCTDYAYVEKLFNKQRAHCLITDPPYGVDYSSKNDFLNSMDKGNCNQKPIQNDAITDYRKWFGKWLGNLKGRMLNTFHLFISGKEMHNLILAVKDCGFKYSQDVVWAKNNHVLGRLDYSTKHENIVYGWFETHQFYGGHQTTVINFPRPTKSELHPTMKPVELVAELITHVSKPDHIIVDLFGGSGTTLIACEQLKRKCFMMELDPHYCSVIMERWEKLTGKTAVKLDG